jgi:hypothetical protein
MSTYGNPKSPNAGRVFGFTLKSGIVAAGLAANSEIVQYRHSDAGNLRKIRILAVNLSAAVDTTGFTAGAGQFELSIARAWTADGSGGNTATITGKSGVFRNANMAFDAHAADSARCASTAALVAGTKTLDAQGISVVTAGFSATAGSAILLRTNMLSLGVDLDNEPLVLEHQEGFIIRATVPVVGTWQFSVDVLAADLSQ